MPTFTSKVAAEVAGVHQQTVIRWAKEGFLEPSVSRRKYEPREYTEQDLAALMLANVAFDVGLPRKDVAEMVKMAQKATEKQLRKALVVTVEGVDEYTGFVRQMWIPGNRSRPTDSKTSGPLSVVQFRSESLYDIVQRMLEAVHERYVKEGLADTEEGERPEAPGEAMNKAREENRGDTKGRKKARKAE